MGTSSTIGIKKSNGQIQAITCHWDGYPEHVGRILHEFYSHEAKAIVKWDCLDEIKPGN